MACSISPLLPDRHSIQKQHLLWNGAPSASSLETSTTSRSDSPPNRWRSSSNHNSSTIDRSQSFVVSFTLEYIRHMAPPLATQLNKSSCISLYRYVLSLHCVHRLTRPCHATNHHPKTPSYCLYPHAPMLGRHLKKGNLKNARLIYTYRLTIFPQRYLFRAY